jgi:hypothetical protein
MARLNTLGRVSPRWIRQYLYREGQRGIDGPQWTWPVTIKAPMDVARRSGKTRDVTDV